jgi:uncharacterized protein YsxB (DUF464 family)
MISVEVTRDCNGRICAFMARNHGESHACAAVSLMILNTVNSIEAFTSQDFDCDYEESGGFICFALKGQRKHDAGLLLDAMLLGLGCVQEQYPSEIELFGKEVIE